MLKLGKLYFKNTTQHLCTGRPVREEKVQTLLKVFLFPDQQHIEQLRVISFLQPLQYG